MSESQQWISYRVGFIATNDAERMKADKLFETFVGLLRANGLTPTVETVPVSGHRSTSLHGKTG